MSLTSVIRYVRAFDSTVTTGAGKTGLAFTDFTAAYLVQGGTLTTLTPETITTLGTYQAPSDAAHIRIKELANADPTKGVYEVHFHNTQVAGTGKKLWLFLSAASTTIPPLEVDLIPPLYNDSVSMDDFKDLVDTGYNPATHIMTASLSGAQSVSSLTISGAFLVSGGATFANATGAGFTCSSSGSNGNGMLVSGNGSGSGLQVNGGINGDGFQALGGNTGTTRGIHAIGGSSGGAGMRVESSGANANAIEYAPNGTGKGISTTSFSCTGEFTVSDGIVVTCSTTNKTGFSVTGNGTGSGMSIRSGAGTSASGLVLSCGSVNGSGLVANGVGTGAGIFAAAAGTGHGLYCVGGVTSGSGIRAEAQGGNSSGMAFVHFGTGKDLDATTTNLVLAKTTNITGLNDIAANAIVTGGAITTSGGAVSTVTSTGAVSGNVAGTVGGMTASGWATAFTVNSTKTYADAVAGSLVKEIADNSGGAALTNASIASAVWEEALAAHTTGGSAGAAQNEIADISARLPASLTTDGMMKSDALYIGGQIATLTAGVPDVNVVSIGSTCDFSTTMKSSLNAATPTVTVGALGAGAIVTASFGICDFTAQMKTSLNNATPSVTVSNKTGFSLANGSIVTATFGTCDFTSTMKSSLATSQAANPVASVTGNITGNVIGSVGSVLGNIGGTLAGFTTGALAQFFTVNSGSNYGASVAGSVVKEIADSAGGSTLTTDAICERMFTYAASASYATADAASVVKQIADNSGGATLTNDSIAQAVWQATNSAYFTTAASIGKSLFTGGNVPGAASGLALVGSDMGTVSVGDKTGFELTAAYDPAKTAAQVGSAMTLTSAYNAAKTAAQVGSAMTLATGAISDSSFTVPTLTTLATGPVGYITQLWRRAFKGSSKAMTGTNGTIKTYADNGTTVVTTQNVTDDGSGNQTVSGAV